MGDDKARQHGMVMARQHGMVLALHFMKLLKSSRKFSEKFFDSMRSIKCINFQELQVRIDDCYDFHLTSLFSPL